MGDPNQDRMEAERLRRRRHRSLAIAFILAAVVVLFYVITVFRMGGALIDRPL